MDTNEEILMLSWQEKGCEICRRQWETGEQPPEIAINIERHAHLHKCNVCGTYWEQVERFAEPIEESQARKFFPDAFSHNYDATHFKAINALEREMENVQTGRLSMPEFFRMFVESDVSVPSANEVMPDGDGFQPLLFDKDGTQMVACFSSIKRASRYANIAPYCLTIRCGEFLRRIPANCGLVVNPGESVGFDISPSGLVKIVTEFD
jgi:hypothetical protein